MLVEVLAEVLLVAKQFDEEKIEEAGLAIQLPPLSLKLHQLISSR